MRWLLVWIFGGGSLVSFHTNPDRQSYSATGLTDDITAELPPKGTPGDTLNTLNYKISKIEYKFGRACIQSIDLDDSVFGNGLRIKFRPNEPATGTKVDLTIELKPDNKGLPKLSFGLKSNYGNHAYENKGYDDWE